MPTKEEVATLLDKLDSVRAADLEGQNLDFKEWDSKSYKDSGALILETVICFANGGGGTIVVGVHDKAIGRSKAILGVPPDFDASVIRKMIYENTDPRLTPTVDELSVPEGTGRLIIMQVHPGMALYTDRKGRAKIRVHNECQPFTGSMRQRALAASGESDLTAQESLADPLSDVSRAGMEKLREIAAKQNAPGDLLRKTDQDLLGTLGLLRDGKITKAALLLVGKDEALAKEFPGYAWSYLRMEGGGQYSDRIDGNDCIAIAVGRLEDRIMAHNELSTMRQGLLHFEYRTYPEVAIREALLNAFAHADYRIPGLIQVKQFDDRLEITNSGGLVGGVAPENILRHTPVARNPVLVRALVQLRLVNRSNLGIHRMFEAMLQEGKEPPIIRDVGDSVRVIFQRSDFSFPFRSFVAEAASEGSLLSLEQLLVMQYLLRHDEIDVATAALICQQAEREAKELLRRMEKRKILDVARREGNEHWRLRRDVEERIVPRSEGGVPQAMAIASARVVGELQRRADAGEPGLTNAALRELTGLDRERVKYLLKKMRDQRLVSSTGRGRGSVWIASNRGKKMGITH